MVRTSPTKNRAAMNTGRKRNPGRNPTRGGEVMPAAAEKIGKKLSPAEMKRTRSVSKVAPPAGKSNAGGKKGRA